MKSPLNRREFIKSSALLAMMAALPGCQHLSPRRTFASTGNNFLPNSPILPAMGFSSLDFNGDAMDRPHDLLWHKDSYLKSKGGIPAPTETVPLVVVGGGMSGLLTAYSLRSYRPIVLEQAPQFGGNSKGESSGNAIYSIGAAYVTAIDEGSSEEKILNELGLLSKMRKDSGEEATVNFRGALKSPFWQGATDPNRAQEFKKAFGAFKKVYDEAYPDIPPGSDSAIDERQLAALDAISALEWMQKTIVTVHPHVEEFVELYAWSSFAASINELSAAQLLNFLSSDLSGTLTLPGGNAGITQALHQNLHNALGANNLRSGAFVIDIRSKGDFVDVCYEDSERNLKTIRAKACVVASPKFVAKRLIEDFSDAQKKAIGDLTYRAYLVANVLLSSPFPSPSYDLFCLRGERPPVQVPLEPEPRAFTDLCFGTWAAQDQTNKSVLTIYKALPYDGARQLLFHPDSHQKHKSRIEAGLPELLTAIGQTPDHVQGIRMTRWGHAIPVAKKGLYASGTLKAASQPHRGNVFFANQDNWANPCFETALAASEEAAAAVKKLLG